MYNDVEAASILVGFVHPLVYPLEIYSYYSDWPPTW